MRALELTLLAVSVLAIIAILVSAALRRRSAKLPAPMVLFLRITLGILFAMLGVVGVLLPIIQGWLFFLLSILVLFPQSRFAVKSLDRIEKRAPRIVAWLRRWGIGVRREQNEGNDEAIRPRVL
ncbi:MAG TPA: hypothetical protein VND45_12830 [Thermoanaerobaculia bacterium]|jgi:heme A synthase|nr:hypothetical protein [Thermoanaerobaculia bacterium]